MTLYRISKRNISRTDNAAYLNSYQITGNIATARPDNDEITVRMNIFNNDGNAIFNASLFFVI